MVGIHVRCLNPILGFHMVCVGFHMVCLGGSHGLFGLCGRDCCRHTDIRYRLAKVRLIRRMCYWWHTDIRYILARVRLVRRMCYW